MKKVIITTGGTGGHIYPALAVIKELEKRGVETLFVGSSTRMENELVPKSGVRFLGIDVSPPSPKNPKSIMKMMKAVKRSLKIIDEEKPEAVIGFGNYISIPLLIAAKMKNVKIYLQEQNATIGSANKMFYRFAEKSFLAFDNTYEELPIKYQQKLEITGNPLREEYYELDVKREKEKIKLDEKEKILLILGGSLGAQAINDAMIKNWSSFLKEKDIRVYWATGKNNYEEVHEKITKYKLNDVIRPYFDNMPQMMAVADLVICRAGALTVSELIQLEKPPIFIPYRFKDVGQVQNTKMFTDNGIGFIYSDETADEAVRHALELIKNEKELREIKAKVKILKKGNSTKKIVDELDIWGNEKWVKKYSS